MHRSGQIAEFAEIRQVCHFPEVDRPIVAMAKEFPARSRTGAHRHERAQLLFAVEGLMVASTAAATWAVPAGHALWLPPGVMHDVMMHGSVAMLTAYIRADEAGKLHDGCRVLAVGPLLEALIVALAAEPPLYEAGSRGDHLASLLLDEVARAPTAAFALPIPRDARLAKLARAMIEEPGATPTIDEWADRIGVSRRTLTRLFREQTGVSFGCWRRRLRLLTAAAREADGEPAARVAASLGYRSLAAFRAMAKREFAAQPTGERSPRLAEAARAASRVTKAGHFLGGSGGSALPGRAHSKADR